MTYGYKERLRQVKWSDYHTAYGVAHDVEDQLINLASENNEKAMDASHELWCGLCHQKAYISSAAEPALPFIIEVLDAADGMQKNKRKNIINMDVVYSKKTDFNAWISLAREVEPLFGPMADELNFQEALRQAISLDTAFCIYSDPNGGNKDLIGGVVISKETNEIVWLAVSQQYRGKGCGRKLIEFAVSRLNPLENMFVQTFDKSVPEGKSARNLYLDFGFTDFKDGGLNPAGVPTVIMQLEALQAI